MAGAFYLYSFSFGNAVLEHEFRRENLEELIPGVFNAVNFPQQPFNGPRYTAPIYLDTQASYHRIAASHAYLTGEERFQRCLQRFCDFMQEESGGLIEPRDILVKLLEDSYANSRHWDSVLADFALMRVLLKRRHFNGSQDLFRGFHTWLMRWAATFMFEAPLETSLQFLEFASDDDYDTLMDTLVRNVSAYDQQRLIDSEGHITLRLDNTVSNRAIKYIRRNYPRRPQPQPQPQTQCSCSCSHPHLRPRSPPRPRPQPQRRCSRSDPHPRPRPPPVPQPGGPLPRPRGQWVPAPGLGPAQSQPPGYGFGGAQWNGWTNGQPAVQVHLERDGGKQVFIGPAGINIY